jgi:predicted nucleic acid-binding protein
MSAVQWGEIVKVVTVRRGPETIPILARYLAQIGFEIVAASAERAERSALLGLKHKIPYADAFGVELASDSHILVTADFGVKSAEHAIRIEFLPTKPTP